MNDLLFASEIATDTLDIEKYKNMKVQYFTSVDLARIAGKGDLELVKYLRENGVKCTGEAMNRAAQYGHLEIVKYLHENGEKCARWAIDLAAAWGHFETVKYLHEVVGLVCTENALIRAAANEYHEIAKYLHENGARCRSYVMIFDEDQFDDSWDRHQQYCDDELLKYEISSKVHVT